MSMTVVFNLFFTAILLLVFLGTLRLPGSEKREVRMVLFAFAVAALLLIRALRSLRKGGQSSSAVPEAFAAYAWATITQYMSSGGFIVRAAVIYFAQKSRCEIVQIADFNFF